MRTEVKAGVFVGAIICAALFIYFSNISRTGDVDFDNPDGAKPDATAAGTAQPAGDVHPEQKPGRAPTANRTTAEPSRPAAGQPTHNVAPPPRVTQPRETPSGAAPPPRSTATPPGTAQPTESPERRASPRPRPTLDDLDRLRSLAERSADNPAAESGAQPRPTARPVTPTPGDFVSLPGSDPRRAAAPPRTTPPPERLAPVEPDATTARPATTPPTRRPTTVAGEKYTVKRGDIFVHIVEDHYGAERYWRDVAAANPMINPDRIIPGQEIVLPPVAQLRPASSTTTPPTRSATTGATARPESNAAVYVVESGDSLIKIAANALGDGKRFKEIFELNRDQLESPDQIKVGMKLKLPARSTTTAPQRP